MRHSVVQVQAGSVVQAAARGKDLRQQLGRGTAGSSWAAKGAGWQVTVHVRCTWHSMQT